MSKKALLVGINDFNNPDWTLRGCVNDTLEMQSLLTTYFDFPADSIRLLHNRDATIAGIRQGLDWLLSDYDGSDVRVLHFSSHGTQVEDIDQDEWECQDEVIVPYDHDWDAPFRDDELGKVFDRIPPQVNFTFIADCCHSGTLQRELVDSPVEFTSRFLEPPAQIAGKIQADRRQRDADFEAYKQERLPQMLARATDEEWETKRNQFEKLLLGRFRKKRYGVAPAERHFLLAGCQDDQTSADAFIDGKYRGAFTWALGKAIREADGRLTYSALIQRAARNLGKDFGQAPQLECPSKGKRVKLFAPIEY